MKDLADNIRRIAKQPKLKGALGSQQDREPIPGKVTPYATGSFSSSSNGGSSSNGETTTDKNPNDSDRQDDTSPFDPNDPITWNGGGGSGSTETSDQTGYQDYESVVNGDAGPQSPPDNTTDSTSSDSFPGGSINGFTGITDCSTGQCVNIHLNGQFPPPDGWDDADTPPVVDGYESGFYWQTESVGNYVGKGYTWTTAVDDWNQTGSYSGLTFTEISPFNGTAYKAQVTSGNLKRGVSSDTSLLLYKQSCLSEDTDVLNEDGVAYCPSSPPTASEWPEDGCYDLALIDGTFQTNQYDGEAPENAGGSIVDVCYGSGKTGRVYVTAQGGVMITETSGGTPTGTAKVYASDGTFQAGGDSIPQFMEQYLPK